MYRGSYHIEKLPRKVLRQKDVHIYFGKMPDPIPLEKLTPVLSPSEKDRYEGYKAPNKQKEFLYGRFFIKSILASYLTESASHIVLSINQHKRPYLATQKLQFNLSHSFGAFAVIVSKDLPVGVDIEYTPRNISISSGRHVFMPEEIASMKAKSTEAAKKEFLQRWTLKEAIYKAADQGPELFFNEFSVDVEELSLSSITPLLAPIHRDMGRFSFLEEYLLSFAIENAANKNLHLQSFQVKC